MSRGDLQEMEVKTQQSKTAVNSGAAKGDPMPTTPNYVPDGQGAVEDLGGPTPENSKPDDNSNMLKTPTGTIKQVKDVITKNAGKADPMPKAPNYAPEETEASTDEVIAEDETATLGDKMLAGLEGGLLGFIKGITEGGGGGVSGLVKTLADGGSAAIQSAALQNVPGGDAVQAMAGVAPNPKKEQIFKNMDFRTFQYDYQFFPRSMEESANIRNIINTFRYHMHPEFKDDDGFLYIYPGEFEIYYYMGDSENPFVHKHTSAVLKEVNVNYTPQGQFTSFDNGAPTQINMTLSFQELSILTKGHLDSFGERPPMTPGKKDEKPEASQTETDREYLGRKI